MSAPLLVLGVGNPLRSDDGVGCRVVELLAASPLPPGVEVVDGGTAGLDLALLVAGRRHVVLVDAVDADGAPGSVVRLDGADLVAGSPAASLHEAGLADALDLARRMGAGPESVDLWGIVPVTLAEGIGLTPVVESAARRVSAAIRLELAEEAA